jgi:MFS transporter, AAHS family, 4-hydroxybenzoate transporter
MLAAPFTIGLNASTRSREVHMGSGPTDIGRSDILQGLLDRPLGHRRVEIVAICFAMALIDGFDIQATAFIAPLVAKQWGVGSTQIGLLLMAGLAGLMLGTIGLGQLSDRIGRKPVLLGSVAGFAILSLATATAGSLAALLGWRLLTGIGLGGATVSALAIVSDIAPGRARAFLVTMMFVGFPLGGSLGGLVAMPLIAIWGWPSIFVLGGLLPLLLLPLLAARLQETPGYLLHSGAPADRLARSVERLLPGAVMPALAATTATARPPAGTLPELFREGRGAVTLTLWALIFLTMIVSYLLISWLPSIGLPLQSAIGVAVAFNIGGISGALLLARLIDRKGLLLLGAAYAVAGSFALLFTQPASVPVTMLLCALIGAGVIGSQFCVTAIASAFYPAPIRATGSGWMLGMGRIGAITGPMAGAALMGSGGDGRSVIGLLALPLFACVALTLALARRRAF